MTDQQIIEYYDSNLHVTLSYLSELSGRSVKELVKLLTEGGSI